MTADNAKEVLSAFISGQFQSANSYNFGLSVPGLVFTPTEVLAVFVAGIDHRSDNRA